MSIGERLSLQGNEFTNDNGLKNTFELSFPTETELDDSLWHNPEASFDIIKRLLKNNHHELTPTTNRLVLKALSIPAFTREFEGDHVTDKTEAAVLDMGPIGSGILNRYLGLRSDRGVAQLKHVLHHEELGDDDFKRMTEESELLDQAINDATVLQLVNRSLRSHDQDDIILLPVSPPAYNELPHTNFTVLRRKQLGRAHLIVAERLPALHAQDPHVNQQRILIKPSELVDLGGSMNQLAEMLVDEYHFAEGIEDDDYRVINNATDRLFAKINDHFDRIQPRS